MKRSTFFWPAVLFACWPKLTPTLPGLRLFVKFCVICDTVVDLGGGDGFIVIQIRCAVVQYEFSVKIDLFGTELIHDVRLSFITY